MNEKQTWDIGRLANWEKNPRTVSKAGLERLKKQIEKLGQYKPLLVTSDGTVLGGNMRLKAYREMGITDVWVSVVEADTEEKKLEYALSDNDRIGEYDKDAVMKLVADSPELDLSLYSIDLGKVTPLDLLNPVETEEDESPEVDESSEPVSVSGEVYLLGRHRLMCGDSTKSDQVLTLMGGDKADIVFTDPPYGISIVGNNGKVGAPNLAKNQVYSEVIGDETTDAARAHYELVASMGVPKIILWGGNYFADFLPFSPSWLIWDKRGDMNGNNFADGEMAWCNFKTPVRIYKQIWNGMIREGEHEVRVHPTQKPVIMLGNVIKDFTLPGQVILDSFGGSGSTLIACEQLNRTCFMMELDPKYCDVIRKRYAKFIGKEEAWQEVTAAVAPR